MRYMDGDRFLLFQPLTILRAHLRSLRNMSRSNSRLQVGLGIALMFSLVLGIWSSVQLQAAIQQWQTHGLLALNSSLWLLCLGIWGGMCLFTILGVPNTLASDESLLLLTLPITPAARFRALYGSFFVTNLWLWTLLQAMGTGYALLSTLGWHAFIWFALLQLGSVVTVGFSLLLTLLVMRYLLPRGHKKQRAIVATASAITALLVALFYDTFIISIQIVSPGTQPELALTILLLLLVLLVGPCATMSGKLYLETALLRQSQDRARKALTPPGARLLSSLFSNRRSLTGAFFARSIVNQSRNWLFWGRLVIIWSLLALFPSLRTGLHQYGFTDMILIVGYAASLSVGHILETAPSAISGEANRLALYLTAPFEVGHILWAKLALFFLPILTEALAMGLLLCWWIGLDLSHAGYVIMLIPLIVLPCTVLLVWGSVWDENLNRSVEGLADMLLLEEGPFSPRRILLVTLCLICLAVSFLLLWRLPIVSALLALILFNIVLVPGMQRLAAAQLHHLLRLG